MADNNLQNVGNAIKGSQYSDGSWAQDLEFDPIDCTFKPVPHGTGTGDGQAILTDGYAF